MLCGEFTALEQHSESGWQQVKPKPSCCGVIGYPLGEYFTRKYINPGGEMTAVYSFDPRRLQLTRGRRLRLVVMAYENGASENIRMQPHRTILSEEFDLPTPPEW
jgi:hypothetical protein